MRKNRPQIVGDEIQKIISDIIRNKLKDPRVPVLTSVTEVRMSSDLTHATCYISVFGDDEAKSKCMSAIEHAKGFIRTEMCRQINLRVAPELHFKLDTSLEDAARLSKFIDDTIAEDKRKRGEI